MLTKEANPGEDTIEQVSGKTNIQFGAVMLQAVYSIFVRNFTMFCGWIFSLTVFWQCILGQSFPVCANWSDGKKKTGGWDAQLALNHGKGECFGSLNMPPGTAFGFPAYCDTVEPHYNEVASDTKIPSSYPIFIISVHTSIDEKSIPIRSM